MRRRSSKCRLLAIFEVVLRQILFPLLITSCATSWAAVPLRSAHALVVDDDTSEVLLEKGADVSVPIASLTKLMTAMVILDARQPANERIQIDRADVNALPRPSLGIPVGASFTRRSLLELALMSSDNRAAMALARAYPGGLVAFKTAMAQKIRNLALNNTSIEEPTGLSPNNRASAMDIAGVLRAASTYPDITQFTAQSSSMVEVRGRKKEYRNTNKLVGAVGWNILLSKTGFTNQAGRCVAMRMLTAAGRSVTVVLLGAWSKSQRTRDALKLRSWLAEERRFPTKPAGLARPSLFTKAVFKPESVQASQFAAVKISEAMASKDDRWSLRLDSSLLGLMR